MTRGQDWEKKGAITNLSVTSASRTGLITGLHRETTDILDAMYSICTNLGQIKDVWVRQMRVTYLTE